MRQAGKSNGVKYAAFFRSLSLGRPDCYGKVPPEPKHGAAPGVETWLRHPEDHRPSGYPSAGSTDGGGHAPAG